MTPNGSWAIWIDTPWGWLHATYPPNDVQAAVVRHGRRWYQWRGDLASNEARIWVIREIEQMREGSIVSPEVYG